MTDLDRCNREQEAMAEQHREWGFITEKGWLHWTRYAGEFPERCD